MCALYVHEFEDVILPYTTIYENIKLPKYDIDLWIKHCDRNLLYPRQMLSKDEMESRDPVLQVV